MTLLPAQPRHFAFHQAAPAYVINEIALTLTLLAFDAEHGTLEAKQTFSTCRRALGRISIAEVVVHPSGKFLYGSNRGHNSISVFAIDPASGKLTMCRTRTRASRRLAISTSIRPGNIF